MKLQVNRVYKIKHSLYDPWNEDTYIVRIVAEARASGEDIYYPAVIVSNNEDGRTVYLYPSDWSVIDELSSLELELL